MTVLTTKRLRLEPFDESHVSGLNDLNNDPEVFRYITGTGETLDETKAVVKRVQERWAEWGYSWWSFVELQTGEVIGCGCIQHLGRDAANPLEIGWRLRRDRWKQGLASEAAQRMAGFAFDTIGAKLLLSVCHPDNTGSARVMRRLGMKFRAFERWYEMDTAVYEMTQSDWQQQRQ